MSAGSRESGGSFGSCENGVDPGSGDGGVSSAGSAGADSVVFACGVRNVMKVRAHNGLVAIRNISLDVQINSSLVMGQSASGSFQKCPF